MSVLYYLCDYFIRADSTCSNSRVRSSDKSLNFTRVNFTASLHLMKHNLRRRLHAPYHSPLILLWASYSASVSVGAYMYCDRLVRHLANAGYTQLYHPTPALRAHQRETASIRSFLAHQHSQLRHLRTCACSERPSAPFVVLAIVLLTFALKAANVVMLQYERRMVSAVPPRQLDLLTATTAAASLWPGAAHTRNNRKSHQIQHKQCMCF